MLGVWPALIFARQIDMLKVMVDTVLSPVLGCHERALCQSLPKEIRRDIPEIRTAADYDAARLF
jgi:hypothetical protein